MLFNQNEESSKEGECAKEIFDDDIDAKQNRKTIIVQNLFSIFICIYYIGSAVHRVRTGSKKFQDAKSIMSSLTRNQQDNGSYMSENDQEEETDQDASRTNR